MEQDKCLSEETLRKYVFVIIIKQTNLRMNQCISKYILLSTYVLNNNKYLCDRLIKSICVY